MYCTSNNRECTKRSQQSHNRLVCIVRVISVSVRSALNNRTTGLCDEAFSTGVQQACVNCISNKRECAKRAQQSWNRLVYIVRVIGVRLQSALNDRTTG